MPRLYPAARQRTQRRQRTATARPGGALAAGDDKIMDGTIRTERTIDVRRESARRSERRLPAVTRRGVIGTGAALSGAALAACGAVPGSEAPAVAQQPKTVIFHTDWV